MSATTDQNYLRENGLADTIGMVLGSSPSTKNDTDDLPDYNEAFPQLTSTGQFDLNRSNTFFSSAFNGLNTKANTTTSALYSATKVEEDRRRKQAIHEKSATTKIVRKIKSFSLFF